MKPIRTHPPEPALLIHLSLASGAKHGHAMMLDLETFSGIRVGPGSLYGALERLERAGLIEPVPARTAVSPTASRTVAGSRWEARSPHSTSSPGSARSGSWGRERAARVTCPARRPYHGSASQDRVHAPNAAAPTEPLLTLEPL